MLFKYSFILYFLLIITNKAFAYEDFYQSYDGSKIRYKIYKTELIDTTKTPLIFIQGRNEFVEKYEHFYEFLNKKGYTVYTFDLRGQGKSDGQRCYIDSYDTYVKDFLAFFDFVSQKTKSKITVISHSTGALILLRSLPQVKSSKLNKVLLTSPFLGIRTSFVPDFFVKILLKSLLYLGAGKQHVPFYGVDLDFAKNNLTHDQEVYSKYRTHALKCGRPTFSWVYASYNAFAEVYDKKNINKLKIPVEIFVAEKDTVVDKNESYSFCKAYKNCNLHEYKGMYHEILNEKQRRLVFEDIQKLIR